MVTYTRPAAFIVLSVAMFLHRTEIKSPERVLTPLNAAPGTVCIGTPITNEFAWYVWLEILRVRMDSSCIAVL